jgi:aspartate/methionine/tyrosine aminotransferase
MGSAAQAEDDPIGALLARRRALELEHGDGDTGNFLFGWQCENPFAAGLLARTRELTRQVNYVPYSYLEDEPSLTPAIVALHRGFGEPPPDDVFSGSGAMSIIFTFASWLRNNGVEEVYFVPPIYFSFHFALRLLGIRARAITALHAFEPRFRMNLPEKKCVLIISDPIWYAAQPVPDPVIDLLIDWQARTQSTIFVDGSFQYMSWDDQVAEPTSRLDSDLTIRLISPTKSLAVAGYRFAYCLLPRRWRLDFAHTYTNIYGSANAETLVFAPLAIQEMASRTLTESLVGLMRQRHAALRERGSIESRLEPRRGFFAFERINAALPDGYLTMGGEYFSQPRFEGYARINLLSPSIGLLLNERS